MGLGRESFLYGARLYWHSYDLFYSIDARRSPSASSSRSSPSTWASARAAGAEGVGRSTTASVVFMIIAVLVSDAMFPPLFLN